MKNLEKAMEFYDSKGVALNKVIQRGMFRFGLQEYPIIQAAVEVYNDIQKGKEIKDIRLAWEIWAKAKVLRFSVKDLRTMEQVRADNSQLEEENKILMRYTIGLTIVLILTAIAFWGGY